MFTGFPLEVSTKWESFERAWKAQESMEIPDVPGVKRFTPKCGLPRLNSYRK